MNAASRIRRRAVLAVAVGLLAIAAAGLWLFDRDQPTINERAAQVMPFDLNATTHTFTKNETGGVELVIVNDPADYHNLTLVRSHLLQEAERFRQGDYSDPAAIHGMDMPGLNELRSGAARVDVSYEAVANGAQITYSSSDPTLIDALHAWFDRQTTDHAMTGMGG